MQFRRSAIVIVLSIATFVSLLALDPRANATAPSTGTETVHASPTAGDHTDTVEQTPNSRGVLYYLNLGEVSRRVVEETEWQSTLSDNWYAWMLDFLTGGQDTVMKGIKLRVKTQYEAFAHLPDAPVYVVTVVWNYFKIGTRTCAAGTCTSPQWDIVGRKQLRSYVSTCFNYQYCSIQARERTNG
ncbi:hypothetical protein F0U44_14770 [Nocardioides humilatus]|uniref:Uncharacterized protein n=1 Tax=Nocardioides humilatus TaxID=2607660 RepID=A0A5B1LC86_9ACTN|nr:hypothetical protein [Nocardioides humilatus]KAA1417904.1 hypothetical protein F0U44_14770 [Nocardioides humilatus]